MKSSFDQEVQRILQENVFDNLASGAWGAAKALGKGVAKTAWGLSGGREMENILKTTAGKVGEAIYGTSKPAAEEKIQGPRSLKSVPNLSNNIKTTVMSSVNLNAADRTNIQNNLTSLVNSVPTVTDQQLFGVITAVLTKPVAPAATPSNTPRPIKQNINTINLSLKQAITNSGLSAPNKASVSSGITALLSGVSNQVTDQQLLDIVNRSLMK